MPKLWDKEKREQDQMDARIDLFCGELNALQEKYHLMIVEVTDARMTIEDIDYYQRRRAIESEIEEAGERYKKSIKKEDE